MFNLRDRLVYKPVILIDYFVVHSSDGGYFSDCKFLFCINNKGYRFSYEKNNKIEVYDMKRINYEVNRKFWIAIYPTNKVFNQLFEQLKKADNINDLIEDKL